MSYIEQNKCPGQQRPLYSKVFNEDPLESRAGLPMCIKSVNKNRLTIVIGNEK